MEWKLLEGNNYFSKRLCRFHIDKILCKLATACTFQHDFLLAQTLFRTVLKHENNCGLLATKKEVKSIKKAS